jgi:hypothetical protein
MRPPLGPPSPLGEGPRVRSQATNIPILRSRKSDRFAGPGRVQNLDGLSGFRTLRRPPGGAENPFFLLSLPGFRAGPSLALSALRNE